MTVSPAAPDWAVELVWRVCTEGGVAPPGQLRWRRRRGEHSTGITSRTDGLVAVRAGHDPTDQRLTLLHELAHWLAPLERRSGRRRALHHGARFYALAFDLYRRHGVGDERALELESARYPASLRHAARLGVPGAAAAVRARRAAMRSRERRPWRVLVPEHPVRLERDGRWTVCGTCRQRIVGPNLVRLRRRRTPARHVLFSRG